MATAPITITHIHLANNPAPFLQPIAFSFTYLAHRALQAPLEWRVIYVGSALDESCDQVLEEFETKAEDVEVGRPLRSSVECPAPDYTKIPRHELLSPTAIIITVSYQQAEFLRIGYFVHIQADGALTKEAKAHAPAHELVHSLTRTILTDKPRITKFQTHTAQQQPSKKPEILLTPSKSEKEVSNSLLSVSKTSCNDKEQDLTDLVPVGPAQKTKKEKKIKKSTPRASS